MKNKMNFKIKGMQRDLSKTNFNPEYSFENNNIRFITNDENSLMEITNERGPKDLSISINGNVLGYCYIKELNIIVIFSHDNNNDYISIYEVNNNNYYSIFKGNLNFNDNNHIQTIYNIENDILTKVYWIDGINQPRVIKLIKGETYTCQKSSFDFIPKMSLKEKVTINKINSGGGIFPVGVIQYIFTYINRYLQESNIFYVSPLYYLNKDNKGTQVGTTINNAFNININNADSNFEAIKIYSLIRTSVDSTPITKEVATINITKDDISNIKEYTTPVTTPTTTTISVVIQRLNANGVKFSEYNLNLNTVNDWLNKLESGASKLKIIITSRDNNIITINIPTNRFYYKLINTGVYWEFSIKNYTDSILDIEKEFITNSISYTDYNASGSSIEPTDLLYKGGKIIIPNTLAVKNNTMFFGNLQYKDTVIPIDIAIKAKELAVNMKMYNNNIDNIYFKSIKSDYNNKGYYNYKNQLEYNSRQIKHFKYLEWYRLGIQAQLPNGEWSKPIHITDKQCTTPPINKGTENYFPIFYCDIKDIKDALIKVGYINVRPVIVYPKLADRECKCQGVLCPTVFNMGDRINNTPTVQSSWFYRPYSLYTIVNDSNTKLDRETSEFNNTGNYVEYRHYMPIPTNKAKNAEIQNIYSPGDVKNTDGVSDDEYVQRNKENYYVDCSIVTLHSPDIEFDNEIRTADLSKCKLRIVGYVEINAFHPNVEIVTSTPTLQYKLGDNVTSYNAIGFMNPLSKVSLDNNDKVGSHTLTADLLWYDEVYARQFDNNTNNYICAFAVYPWQRSGSLNNQKYADANNYLSAKLQYKKWYNLRFSNKTQYLTNSNPTNNKDIYNSVYNCQGGYYAGGVSDIKIWDSSELTAIKLKAPKIYTYNNTDNTYTLIDSNTQDIIYYGNIDKYSVGNYLGAKKLGYPIICGYKLIPTYNSTFNREELYNANRVEIYDIKDGNNRITDDNNTTSYSPVRIKYKSTPHAVLAFNYVNVNNILHESILPTYRTFLNANYSYGYAVPNSKYPTVFNSKVTKCVNNTVNNNNSYNAIISMMDNIPNSGFLWLGEIYDDTIDNKYRFGGTTDSALEQNEWLVCGDSINITDNKQEYTVKWEEGDTYYQRYDNLKTYPYTNEDENSVIEVLSFMCETRINIDGRYDNNRSTFDGRGLNNSNFNLMEYIYSQKDNFFTYRGNDYVKDLPNNYPNLITWTKSKENGEITDTWTNITLASTLLSDTTKGKLESITSYNDQLLIFQDNAIGQLMYNENVQISSTAGVPIEIANSNKVSGVRYLTNSIGCQNKWSIVEGLKGLYFIDYNNNAIYSTNGSNIVNMSETLGFNTWSKSNINNTTNYISIYDKHNNDVLFISNNNCLAYSELLGCFTSFYKGYSNQRYLVNTNNKSLWLNSSIYEHNNGEYNKFFNRTLEYNIEIIANQEPIKDKIFDTIEFTADKFNDNTLVDTLPFNKLSVYNEYQNANIYLQYTKDKPSNIKKKFRIWRINVPRDSSNNRDRMRNIWLDIKLSNISSDTYKMIFHDISVDYYV